MEWPSGLQLGKLLGVNNKNVSCNVMEIYHNGDTCPAKEQGKGYPQWVQGMNGGNSRLRKDSENHRISLKRYKGKSWNNTV